MIYFMYSYKIFQVMKYIVDEKMIILKGVLIKRKRCTSANLLTYILFLVDFFVFDFCLFSSADATTFVRCSVGVTSIVSHWKKKFSETNFVVLHAYTLSYTFRCLTRVHRDTIKVGLLTLDWADGPLPRGVVGGRT